MLRKLLKYELRAGLRSFVFVWVGVLLLGLLQLLLGFTDVTAINALVTAVSAIANIGVVGANIYAFIYIVRRFYQGLLGREGYLMFTLPVSPTKHLLSKLISALLLIFATTIVTSLSKAVAAGDFEGLFYADYMEVWEYTLVPLLALTAVCMGILQIYFACCLGHLFRKHRVMWAVIIYYALSFVMIFALVLLLASLLTTGLLFGMEADLLPSLLLFELCLAVVCVALFIGSACILKKRLNLE